MSTSLYPELWEIINTQQQFIALLVYQLSSIYANSKAPRPTDIADLDYQKMTVDELPKVVEMETLDYKELLQEHLHQTGKPLKPVQRRASSPTVSSAIHCPRCQAPADYLYLNNGKSDNDQYLCKVCANLFNYKNRYTKEVIFQCPHCEKNLVKIKDRKGFDIYKCLNKACPYYKKRLKSLSKKELKQFKKNKSLFKMHYIYRNFDLTLSDLEAVPDFETKVRLNKIHSSPYVLGLILTYHVNYGLSAEKTAALMFDVHQLKISGQTIRNYARTVAHWVQPLTDYYPYELSDQFCGDETYIRVQGKWHYIYFFFDAEKKIILSHRYNRHRDTETAIKAIHDVIRRFKQVPDALQLVVDGNPIYKLAQAFYAQNGIDFEVIQVIGLTNKDKVSQEYRPLKQIIERLNRTFKGNYKPLGGFHSGAGPLAHVTLFTTYFNFLRPHAKLEKNVPVLLPELNECPDMPQKWVKLLHMSEDFIKKRQAS
ncbi:DDE-type integrase/transposase/recombinase [Tetragenococcus koreensis]|uniref:DDE-type integrase/transposase/recombinase n=2 Tax=Tetragenococcus koreensis TaxID=290335 RepID=UPI001F28C250|nr:DDE-type integrase/transposase/recombinase [Tetragenococcus koreensis]MDN5831995.1 DDE-type integrase/transposase/recombinase [Tetragenococcus halophilus]MDN6311215.1 DDE-type integrase/transposase/recombinase [Psychroflexus sp.]MDN6327543.1 DDE-type integrase/transposase/recombinase [Alkalibacterium sp.]MCF1619080.1 DDE-type integrase/transposase/recombinase [Tetragenococcus koreensis]MCF1656531.1 DDE-type integrase/transposase/recombinase [Tetragenococcus koreensis]